MGEDAKAIVIAARFGRNVAYVFHAFEPALAFLRSSQADTVVVEFSVEADTLDFYDAAKALRVPIIFAANRLGAALLSELGIAPSVMILEGQKRPDSFADYRPRPGFAPARGGNLMREIL